MAVNVKLGVDLGDFKSGIANAKEEIKTFDAALKYAEASLNATGDAASAMTTKSEALRGKLEAQTRIVNQYTDALKKMNDNGVDKSSASYQKMQRDLINAQAAMMNTQAQINGLNTSQQAASKSANDLATNVGKIGKNVSLQTVADGVNKLTTSLERGARAAIRIGKNIARSAMDSTGYADDLTTRSTQYGIDVETLQRMEKVAAYIDTDVDAIISARDRMSKNRASLAELLGISSDGKSVDDVFWEAGEKIKNMGEGFDQNDAAMKIFGRSWRELLPLFTAGREEYEALMASQDVLTADQVKSLAQADDAIQSIQQQIDLLKNQFVLGGQRRKHHGTAAVDRRQQGERGGGADGHRDRFRFAEGRRVRTEHHEDCKRPEGSGHPGRRRRRRSDRTADRRHRRNRRRQWMAFRTRSGAEDCCGRSGK